MDRVRVGLCHCLMFLGVLALTPWVVVRAAPVPPTECDDKCRNRQGPFQAGVADDPEAACWWYPDHQVCNNCQSGATTWNCSGAYSETDTYCLTQYVVETLTAKEDIDPDPDTGLRCKKHCNKLNGGQDGQQRVMVGVLSGVWTFVPRKVCAATPP